MLTDTYMTRGGGRRRPYAEVSQGWLRDLLAALRREIERPDGTLRTEEDVARAAGWASGTEISKVRAELRRAQESGSSGTIGVSKKIAEELPELLGVPKWSRDEVPAPGPSPMPEEFYRRWDELMVAVSYMTGIPLERVKQVLDAVKSVARNSDSNAEIVRKVMELLPKQGDKQ